MERFGATVLTVKELVRTCTSNALHQAANMKAASVQRVR